jgi:hypothetical protein
LLQKSHALCGIITTCTRNVVYVFRMKQQSDKKIYKY